MADNRAMSISFDLESRPSDRRRSEPEAASDPIGEPPAVDPARPLADAVIPCEAVLLDILRGGALPGETAFAAFERKEGELRRLLDGLTPYESHFLRKRLATPRPGDALATAFGRLVIERRDRLLAFLADARRREALRRSR